MTRLWWCALALPLGAVMLEACTTHLLAAADKGKLLNSLALEGQMYQDLAEDSGVPRAVLQAESRALFCSDESVLAGSGAAPADDASVIHCPALGR